MSSVESLSLVQPFMAHFISKYFVIVNLQLYLAAAFTFSILFLYELFPTARMSEFFYWLVNLMCFATILLIMKLYVCRVSYSYIIPDLFYYLHSSFLLESLNSWLLPLGYPDFGAVWWFNSLSLSLSFTGAWNQGFWLPIQMHLQMIQKETRPWNSTVTLVNLFPQHVSCYLLGNTI